MKKILLFLEKYKYVLLVLLGLIILYFRSAHNLFYPNIYAEDGAWLTNIWNEGYLQSVFTSRQDYFVFGLVSQLKIADFLCNIFFGGNIVYLPYTIAFVSYIFYICVALLPCFLLRKRLSKFSQIFLYFMILLLPMGITSNEIIGRILQGHFYIWFITFCLLAYRYDHKEENKYLIGIIDLGILACICTNPVVLIEIAVYILIEFYNILKKYYKKGISYIVNIKRIISIPYCKHLLLFCSILLIVGIILSVRMIGYQDLEVHNPANFDNTIEFLVRSLIYPLVFPFYNNLNNTVGILLLILMLVIYIVGYLFIDKKNRNFYLISIISTICITFIMLITRSYLTGSLLGYVEENIPDRYFLAMNISSLVTITIIISNMKKSKVIHYLSLVLIIYCVSVYSVNYKKIFIYKQNKCLAITSITFKEQLKNAKFDEEKNYYVVEIDPWWEIEIPRYKLDVYLKEM